MEGGAEAEDREYVFECSKNKHKLQYGNDWNTEMKRVMQRLKNIYAGLGSKKLKCVERLLKVS